jgi:hypothetical protein
VQDSRTQCINGLLIQGSTPEQAAAACDQPIVAAIRESLCANPLRLSGALGGLIEPGRLGVEVVADGLE